MTEEGGNLLLAYDAYRARLSLAVLELFDKNGGIAYAIPVNTSGKTQPCDFVVFSKFKEEVNEALNNLLDVDTFLSFVMYEFFNVLLFAYRKAFLTANIVSSFRRSGLWPVDPTRLYRLLGQHRRMNWGFHYLRNDL